MDRIFWGMVFVLLDINITLGGRTVGLMPDWLGWWWLAQGCFLLEAEWKGFTKRQIPVGMAVVTVGLYIAHLLTLTVQQRFALYILEFLATAAAVAAAGLLIRGIRKMEQNRQKNLQSEKLRSLWIYLAVIHLLKGLLGWIPLVGTGCAVAAFTLGLCWLGVLWETKKRYHPAK